MVLMLVLLFPKTNTGRVANVRSSRGGQSKASVGPRAKRADAKVL